MTLNTQAQDLDLSYFARVLRGAMLPMLLFSTALAALAYFYSKSQPEVFQATASLAALPANSGNSLINNTLVTAPALPANVVARAIHSSAVTTSAFKRIDAQFPGSAVAAQTVQAIREELQSGNYHTVSLGAEIDQNLVGSYEISVLAGSPQVAKGAADAFAQALLEWDRERALNGINRARTNLLTQRDMLNRGMLAGGEVVTGRTLDQLQSEVVQSLQQIEMLRQTVSGTLTPLSEAVLPVQAVAPKPVRNALLTFGAALFFSLLGVLARDRMSRRVHDEDGLRSFGLPVLGMLPPLPRAAAQNMTRIMANGSFREQLEFVRVGVLGSLGAWTKPAVSREYTVEAPVPTDWNFREQLESARAEALAGVVPQDTAAVPWESAKGFLGSPVIAISSANVNEGKSTLTAGLAQVCAERGMRVLVVDADVFRHRQQQLLMAGREQLLQSREVGMTQVWREVLPGVDLMTLTSNRLEPENLRRNILELKSQYDIVMVDTPPALKIADTVAFARMLDGLVIVVDVRTPLGQLERLVAETRRLGVNTLGFVLNRYKQTGAYYASPYNVASPRTK